MVDAKTDRSVRLTFKDLAMMGFMAFGTVGCLVSSDTQGLIDAGKTPLATTLPKMTPTPAASPTLTTPGSYRLNEFQYRPSNRQPTASEVIRAGNSSVEYLNFSDFVFNSQTLREYLGFLTQLPQQLPEIDIRVGERDLRFNIKSRPNIARRIYLIRPSDPMPIWWANIPPEITAITRTLSRNDGLEEAVTVVRLFPSPITRQGGSITISNINQVNEWTVMTEACQSSIGLTGQSDSDNRSGQETLCNTLGVAALIRSENGSYESFQAVARTLPMQKSLLPMFFPDRFPKEQFNQVSATKVTH